MLKTIPNAIPSPVSLSITICPPLLLGCSESPIGEHGVGPWKSMHRAGGNVLLCLKGYIPELSIFSNLSALEFPVNEASSLIQLPNKLSFVKILTVSKFSEFSYYYNLK